MRGVGETTAPPRVAEPSDILPRPTGVATVPPPAPPWAAKVGDWLSRDARDVEALGTLLFVALQWGSIAPLFKLLDTMEHRPDTLLALLLPNFMALAFYLARGGLRFVAAGGPAMWGGLEVGFWFHVANLVYFVGVSRTLASNATFLGSLSTVIVPVMQAGLGTPVPANVWAACAAALLGCVVLAGASAGEPAGGGSLEGDLLCIISTFFYSVMNIRLTARAAGVDAEALGFWSKASTAVLSAGTLAVAVGLGACASPAQYLTEAAPSELLAVAGFAVWDGAFVKGLLNLWLVGAYQVVTPSEAEVALSTNPLWSLLLAVLLLGEPLGQETGIGAGLFVAALALAAAPAGETQREGKKTAEAECG